METIPASTSRGDVTGDVRGGKREILSRRTSYFSLVITKEE